MTGKGDAGECFEGMCFDIEGHTRSPGSGFLSVTASFRLLFHRA